MLYDGKKFIVIAGPCSLESEGVSMKVAEKLSEVIELSEEITVIFKGSFDKANRTSHGGKRGPGIKEGLKILKGVKERYGFPVVTDVHDVGQVKEVAEVCDVLQIPAFLCRQTDLLVAAAETGRVVQVKKGQFLSPYEMKFVVDKLKAAGAAEVWQVERGTTFGYQNLVVDFRSIGIMKGHAPEMPVIYDASHSLMLPGAVNGASGGQIEHIRPLTYGACAAGVDGIFIETHPNPKEAISDKETQLPLGELVGFVKNCYEFWALARKLR